MNLNEMLNTRLPKQDRLSGFITEGIVRGNMGANDKFEVVSGGTTDMDELFALSGADREVVLRPSAYWAPAHQKYVLNGKFDIVDNRTGIAYGQVELNMKDARNTGELSPKKYQLHHNAEMKPSFQRIFDMGGKAIHSSFFNGKFTTLFEFPEFSNTTIAGEDYKILLLVSAGQDGKSAIRFNWHITRLACWNMLVAMLHNKHSISVPHWGNMNQRIHIADQAIARGPEAAYDVAMVFDKMSKTYIPENDLDKVIAVATSCEKEYADTVKGKRDKFPRRLLETKRIQSLGNGAPIAHGSVYDWFHAMTYANNNTATIRSTESSPSNRFYSNLTGSKAKDNVKIMNVMTQYTEKPEEVLVNVNGLLKTA